jgi:hypothetical protein
MDDLAAEGGEVARLVDAAHAHVAVEVAIRTFVPTERPMHIDAEAGVAGRVVEHHCGKGRLRFRAVMTASALAVMAPRHPKVTET